MAAPRVADWPPAAQRRTVVAGGVAWHVVTCGQGPGLLAVHGTGSSSHSFRRLAPLLADRFTVIVPDLPGHAGSRAPDFRPGIHRTARALGALVEALDVSIEVALGHSAGAALACRMALDRRIEPRLVVGLAAALVPLPWSSRWIGARWAAWLADPSRACRLARAAAAPAAVEAVLRSTGSRLDRPSVELYRELATQPEHLQAVLCMMAHWDLEPLYDALPRLEQRVLLLAGARDRAIRLGAQRQAARRFRDATLAVVPDAGHLVHEEQPRRVSERVIAEAARTSTPRRVQ